MSEDLDVPPDAAAVVFDKEGVTLLVPGWIDDDRARDVPRYVLAAAELALRYGTPEAVDELASAFEARDRN